MKNRFESGDTLQLVTPQGNVNFDLPTIENKDGIGIAAAPGSGHIVRIPLPEGVTLSEQQNYAMLMRYIA